TSKRERNPLYLPGLEVALRGQPAERFIWAHAGTCSEIHRHLQKLDFPFDELERMLGFHTNLYIDQSSPLLAPHLLDKDGKAEPDWVKLVEQYPDRFMIGSDVVGRFDNLGKHLQAFDVFLNALDESVAHKVARDNFLAILPGRGE